MNFLRYSGLLLLIGAACPALAQKALAPASPLQTAVPAVKPATVSPPAAASPTPVSGGVMALPALPTGSMVLPAGGSLRPNLQTGKPSTEMPQAGGSIQDTKARNMDMPTGRDNTQGVLGDGGKIEPDKDGLIGGNVIKGGRYGDTFAGDKVNSQHRGDTNDFSGGSKGGQVSMIPGGSGGESGGGQTAPAPSAGDSGGSSIPMSNGDSAGTLNGVASGGGKFKDSGNASTIKLEGQAISSKLLGPQGSGNPKKREQEDAPSTGGAPMGRSDVVNAGRAIGTRTGAAGGSGDGRGEVDAGPQGGGGGLMRAQGTAGAAEKEDQRGATVSMEQMLKINTQVNPGAR